MNKEKEPWESVYEIHEDYVAAYGGDIDVWLIYNKISKTYHLTSKGETWYCDSKADTIRIAKMLYNKDQAALEKALLDSETKKM